MMEYFIELLNNGTFVIFTKGFVIKKHLFKADETLSKKQYLNFYGCQPTFCNNASVSLVKYYDTQYAAEVAIQEFKIRDRKIQGFNEKNYSIDMAVPDSERQVFSVALKIGYNYADARKAINDISNQILQYASPIEIGAPND